MHQRILKRKKSKRGQNKLIKAEKTCIEIKVSNNLIFFTILVLALFRPGLFFGFLVIRVNAFEVIQLFRERGAPKSQPGLNGAYVLSVMALS